jgi:DNA-binding XRE family transcriptional regulator
MNTSAHEIAAEIQRRRVENNMEMAELAKRCDVNVVTLYRIERGGGLPAVWLFARIVKALKWDPVDALAMAARTRSGKERKER